MSDEDIIEYWKKGYNVEKIVKFFPSVLWGHREPSWQMYNRVETVILNYQNKIKGGKE